MTREAPHLALVLPGVPSLDGRVEVSNKTWAGLDQVQKRWPGELTVVARPVAQDPGGNLGLHWYAVDELPWRLELGEPIEVATRLAPDVAQLPLHLSERPVLDRVPSVVVAENSARERFRYAASSAQRSHLPRMAAGAVRQALALRRMVASAAGLACNGWGAWDTYRDVATGEVPPLLFFDTRLSLARVLDAGSRLTDGVTRTPGPLRLAFSGRVHPAKGAYLAVAASAELRRRGCEHTLVVLGDGPDRPRLESEAGEAVSWLGQVPFDPEWIDYVSAHVDVMVLPHTQGDPSGTYLEAAGLGVPVAGVANVAMRGHAARAGFAVTASRTSASSLADVLEGLARSPERRLELGRVGVAFMREHAMEPTFDARVEHLLAVARGAR